MNEWEALFKSKCNIEQEEKDLNFKPKRLIIIDETQGKNLVKHLKKC